MMLMFYRRRASPKHYYSIIEVDYGGGGAPHTAKRSHDQLLCLGCPPAPVYKGARRGGAAGQGRRARRSPTPTGSRTPSLPCWIRRRGKEEEEKKEKGGAAPFLVQFGLEGEGARSQP